MTNRRLGVVMLLGVSLVGCQLNQKADADPAVVHRQRGVRSRRWIRSGDPGENLRLRFDDVLEDSRCPKGVECFWTGQARIAIRVLQAGDSTTAGIQHQPRPRPEPAIDPSGRLHDSVAVA